MNRRLILSYLIITAFVLLILEIPLGVTFQRSERAQLISGLERDARGIASLSQDALEATPPVADQKLKDLVTRYADHYAKNKLARVLVVDDKGNRVADSDKTDQHTNYLSPERPEIVIALDKSDQKPQSAVIERHSSILNRTFIFVAVPVISGDRLLGAVRLSYPSDALNERVRNNWLALGLLSVVVLAAVAIVGSLLARSVTLPVRSVEEAASALSAGNLQARAPSDYGPPEVRRLASEFNDMAVRLGSLIGAQRAFVADASHELRTPLTALRLRLENLEFATPEDLPREVDTLTNEIGRLSRLVEGLLSLARAEGQRPEREIVNLDEELAQRVDAWEAFASEDEITLEQIPFKACQVLAVRGAVAQIVDNYLANAIEVSPNGSTIQVSVDVNHINATITVTDNGPGMPDHERGRAFDRFWRSPGAAPGRGSGLGLAIVRQLAEASGGSATLLAAPSGGIAATVTLPLALAETK